MAYSLLGPPSLLEGSVVRVEAIDEGSARAPPEIVEIHARCQACMTSIQSMNGVNVIPRRRMTSEVGIVKCEGVGAWNVEPGTRERQFWALSCCCQSSIACSIICDWMLELSGNAP